jgi:hypothetical protein
MTLIAAFKCSEGYVICADSEIKVTDEAGNKSHVSRQKLLPLTLGGIEVAIAGAGDGDLIEAFVARLEKKLKGTSVVQLDSLRQLIGEEIKTFAKEKRISPRRIPDYLRFLVAVHSRGIGSDVWKVITGDPIDVSRYALVGYDDSRYDYAAKNLYRPDMPISQGVFLGLYIMWLAEQTIACVKAPITVAIVKNGGIFFENQAKLDSINHKIRLFTAAFESQFLACSDTGLQNQDFANHLLEFGKTVVQFRQEFIAEWVGEAIDKGLDRVVESWNSIPSGATIVTVPITPEVENSIREQQERTSKTLRETCAHVQEPSRLISNLKMLKAWLNGELASGTEQTGALALSEISQAAMMGPFKLNQESWFMVARVVDSMPVSPEEHKNMQLHRASVALRLAVIDQAIAVLESSTPSTPETLEGQQ